MTTFEILGKLYHGKRHISTDFSKIKDEHLTEIFKTIRSIENAPHLKTSVEVHLIVNDNNFVNIIFTVNDFQGNNVVSLNGLTTLLYEIEHDLGCTGAAVELLDGFWEKLMVIGYNLPVERPRSQNFPSSLRWLTPEEFEEIYF